MEADITGSEVLTCWCTPFLCHVLLGELHQCIIRRARIIMHIKRSHRGLLTKPSISQMKNPWGLAILRDCPRHKAVLAEIQHSCWLVEGCFLRPLPRWLTCPANGIYKAEQETSCPLSAASSVSTKDSDGYGQVQYHSSVSGQETDTGFFSTVFWTYTLTLDLKWPCIGSTVFLNIVHSCGLSTHFFQVVVFPFSLASFWWAVKIKGKSKVC